MPVSSVKTVSPIPPQALSDNSAFNSDGKKKGAPVEAANDNLSSANIPNAKIIPFTPKSSPTDSFKAQPDQLVKSPPPAAPVSQQTPLPQAAAPVQSIETTTSQTNDNKLKTPMDSAPPEKLNLKTFEFVKVGIGSTLSALANWGLMGLHFGWAFAISAAANITEYVISADMIQGNHAWSNWVLKHLNQLPGGTKGVAPEDMTAEQKRKLLPYVSGVAQALTGLGMASWKVVQLQRMKGKPPTPPHEMTKAMKKLLEAKGFIVKMLKSWNLHFLWEGGEKLLKLLTTTIEKKPYLYITGAVLFDIAGGAVEGLLSNYVRPETQLSSTKTQVM